MKYDMNDSFDYKRQISCMTLRLLEFFIWIFYSAKGQLISKCLFGIFDSPKKSKENKIDFTTNGTSSRIVFVRFLGELKTPKRHFEIN